MKCCKCGSRVWPWQQSYITCDPIHSSCHDILISESLKKTSQFKLSTRILKMKFDIGEIDFDTFLKSHKDICDEYIGGGK